MRPLLSEFTYGYGLTEELVRCYLPPLSAAPLFPSLRQEGQAGGGYDLRLQCPGIVLFLQFKLSDGMVYRNATEVHQGFMDVPFFRMHLRTKRISNQHDMLIDLENQGERVYYVAPLFHKDTEMDNAYLHNEVYLQSRLFSPIGIGSLPDNDDHHIAFSTTGPAYLCSEPKEVKMFRPEDVVRTIQGQFEQTPSENTPSVEASLLQARNNMINSLRRSGVLTGPNNDNLALRIPPSLFAAQLPNFPQDIAGQVAYLAMRFFDCATVPVYKRPPQDEDIEE